MRISTMRPGLLASAALTCAALIFVLLPRRLSSRGRALIWRSMCWASSTASTRAGEMSDWPGIVRERADIVILRAPEAWRNYCLAVSQREGYLNHRNLAEATRMEVIARTSLDTYFQRLEELLVRVS